MPSTGDTGLLQPNTLRDALLACATFNMLHSFGDAITFNVLQAMAFTKGANLALTPTYHAFDLYQPHKGAISLRTLVESPTFTGKLTASVPQEMQDWVVTTSCAHGADAGAERRLGFERHLSARR